MYPQPKLVSFQLVFQCTLYSMYYLSFSFLTGLCTKIKYVFFTFTFSIKFYVIIHMLFRWLPGWSWHSLHPYTQWRTNPLHPTVWIPRPSHEIPAIYILDDLPIVSIQGFVETHQGWSTINKQTWCINRLVMFFLNNDKELFPFKSGDKNLEEVHHLEKKVWAPFDLVSTNEAGKKVWIDHNQYNWMMNIAVSLHFLI